MLHGAFKIKILCLSGEKLSEVWVQRGCCTERETPCPCLGLEAGLFRQRGNQLGAGVEGGHSEVRTHFFSHSAQQIGDRSSSDCFSELTWNSAQSLMPGSKHGLLSGHSNTCSKE